MERTFLEFITNHDDIRFHDRSQTNKL